MRLINTLVLSVSVLSAAGQIVIGPGDMPAVGDTIPYRTVAGTNLDPVPTGASFTWDFSSLGAGLDAQDVHVPVSSTPFLYQLYFNNQIIYPDHAASYAVPGEDIGFQGLELTNVYEYFKKGPTGHRNVGFGATVNGLPASVRRVPVDWVYRFPLNYGDIDSSYSTWTLELPGTFHLSEEQMRRNTVDGWGTLLLPSGAYPVLRVRSVLERRDSIYVNQFGTGFGFNVPETVEYKWLAAGMGRPVLIITTVAGIVTTVQYFHDPFVGIAGLEGAEGFSLLPNPASSELHVRLPQGVRGMVQVNDAQGRLVYSSAKAVEGEVVVPVQDLAHGTYTLLVVHGAGIGFRGRFVVAH
jgi:hypothetical protein